MKNIPNYTEFSKLLTEKRNDDQHFMMSRFMDFLEESKSKFITKEKKKIMLDFLDRFKEELLNPGTQF